MPRMATIDVTTVALVTQSGRSMSPSATASAASDEASAKAFHTVSGYTSHLATTIVTTSTPTARSSACTRSSIACESAGVRTMDALKDEAHVDRTGHGVVIVRRTLAKSQLAIQAHGIAHPVGGVEPQLRIAGIARMGDHRL